jgi:hypothetical protein
MLRSQSVYGPQAEQMTASRVSGWYSQRLRDHRVRLARLASGVHQQQERVPEHPPPAAAVEEQRHSEDRQGKTAWRAAKAEQPSSPASATPLLLACDRHQSASAGGGSRTPVS